MSPPNRPDFNPVDYEIWGAHQQKVYLRRQFENVDQLKLALGAEWNRLSQTFINKSIDEWRQRLEAVVEDRVFCALIFKIHQCIITLSLFAILQGKVVIFWRYVAKLHASVWKVSKLSYYGNWGGHHKSGLPYIPDRIFRLSRHQCACIASRGKSWPTSLDSTVFNGCRSDVLSLLC